MKKEELHIFVVAESNTDAWVFTDRFKAREKLYQLNIPNEWEFDNGWETPLCIAFRGIIFEDYGYKIKRDESHYPYAMLKLAHDKGNWNIEGRKYNRKNTEFQIEYRQKFSSSPTKERNI